MYSPPSTCVLPLLMQAKCDSLQESLTHAVDKSKARKQHEQIMVQQMNVRSGLVRARVCVYVLPSLSTCVHKSLILVVHTHLRTYVAHRYDISVTIMCQITGKTCFGAVSFGEYSILRL